MQKGYEQQGQSLRFPGTWLWRGGVGAHISRLRIRSYTFRHETTVSLPIDGYLLRPDLGVGTSLLVCLYTSLPWPTCAPAMVILIVV